MYKFKITNNQIFSLTASFTCGSAILVIPASAAGLAKQDAWIAMILAVICGLFDIGLFRFLWSKHSGITFIEIIIEIFGKWVGSLIAWLFVFFCLLSGSQALWYMGDFVTVEAFYETPQIFINMVFLAAAVIAILYGLEAIARSYEIFIPFIFVLFLLSMILVLPNAKIDNLLPVFEKGITQLLKGSFYLSTYLLFPTVIMLMVFPPHTDNKLEARRAFVKGYLWGGFLVFISIFLSILVLGSTITASSQFPVYLLAREISLGIIFTRLEFIIAAVWVITLLSRVLFYFYAGSLGLSQLLKLKDYKRIALPLAMIVLILSGIAFPDTIYRISWDTYVWPISATVFGLILPLAMAIVFYIKKLLKLRNSGV